MSWYFLEEVQDKLIKVVIQCLLHSLMIFFSLSLQTHNLHTFRWATSSVTNPTRSSDHLTICAFLRLYHHHGLSAATSPLLL